MASYRDPTIFGNMKICDDPIESYKWKDRKSDFTTIYDMYRWYRKHMIILNKSWEATKALKFSEFSKDLVRLRHRRDLLNISSAMNRTEHVLLSLESIYPSLHEDYTRFNGEKAP